MIYRIKVSPDVHGKLTKIKQYMGLSFSEIIDIGVSPLLDNPRKIIIGSDLARMTVNLKRAELPLDMVEKVINDGRDLFIPAITSRKARYIARSLSQKLGVQVLPLSAWLGREAGYVLMFINPSSSSLKNLGNDK